VAERGRPGGSPKADDASGATEPITLTDPDGALTRVAPWSSWTREQVRAPGGEPALVTRLDQGQLWFSAGRRRSPWRHEVHVGPAVVSTPRGRFHAIAEPDGGATIACLAGRTRVVAGLREPVVLGPDQSAAVSSDGRTLVVMDHVAATVVDGDTIDLRDHVVADATEVAGAGVVAPLPDAGGRSPAVGHDVSDLHGPSLPTPVERGGDEDGLAGGARFGWIPELMALAALIALVVAITWVFTRDDDADETSSGSVDTPSTTTEAPTTETTDPPGTTAPSTSAQPTTTTPSTTTPSTTAPSTTAPVAAATATGALVSCRRGDAGVVAAVDVVHRSGPPSAFDASVALVSPQGVQFARGTAATEVLGVPQDARP
jgi:hypothetical protein